MNERKGALFSIAAENAQVDGCTVSKAVAEVAGRRISHFALAAGTGLSEHAAPGEALIFALDGEGVIGYEGKEHAIKAGENFAFAKNGAHWVRAEKPFKMALLLTLD